ncbi:uncharacterized protein LOC124458151 isoform X2 [Xenia sp. Carnegie-2017]|uniref:uncharacterized protein LOC124458151 isoform X2 n=1 Tax=Xenia sp. Carnegie-2017 TaxID=2897299 RepID=UPI001F0376E7|nr:uncharacterized protein LOC124458151 isoform X2 [Xenia sp. Carnegie-2017]
MSFLSQKIFSKCRRMAEVKIVVLIIVWWIASTLTFEFSKDEISITEQSFGDIKWLDLTCLQLIVGCLGSAILLFLLKRRLFGLKIIQSYNSLVAVATNVIGHLLVNVSYAFESSSVTQGHEFLHEVLEKFSLDYSATMNLREVNLMSKGSLLLTRISVLSSATTAKKTGTNICTMLSFINGKNLKAKWNSTFGNFGQRQWPDEGNCLRK